MPAARPMMKRIAGGSRWMMGEEKVAQYGRGIKYGQAVDERTPMMAITM